MSEVTIKCKEHGPLLVTGAVKLTDHEGNCFNLTGKESFALCRCGETKNRPFCDGSHKAAGFQASDKAPATGS